MSENDQGFADLLALTTEIVSSHVSHNSVHGSELPNLITATYTALAGLGQPAGTPVAEPEKPKGAVSLKKSLADPMRIVSMIDGKGYTSLTRSIKRQGFTPQSYREAFGLPKDYPMVAPAYAEKRREIANAIGLGRKKASAVVEAIEEAAPAVIEKAKRGTRKAVAAVAETVAPKAKRARKSVGEAIQSAKEHLPG